MAVSATRKKKLKEKANTSPVIIQFTGSKYRAKAFGKHEINKVISLFEYADIKCDVDSRYTEGTFWKELVSGPLRFSNDGLSIQASKIKSTNSNGPNSYVYTIYSIQNRHFCAGKCEGRSKIYRDEMKKLHCDCCAN